MATQPEPKPDRSAASQAQATENAELAALLQGVARSSEEALGQLYDRLSPSVFGLALRILGNVEDAEETSVDVFRQIWTRAGRYDATLSAPRTWILMITRSRSIDRLRARNRSQQREVRLGAPHLQIVDGGKSPEEQTVLTDQGQHLHTALEGLPDAQRRTVELAFFQGLSHREIATKLGDPLGTVKTRIRLGMQHLLRALREQEGQA